LLETDRIREAIAAYEKCVTISESCGDAWEHSIALFNLGDAYANAGDVERATRLLDDAYRKKQEIGDRWGQAHVHLVRARISLRRDDHAAALDDLGTGLQLATELADPRLTAALNNSIGRTRLLRGEQDEAQRAFGFALRDAERCAARLDTIRALLGLSCVHLQRGKIAAAQRHADRAHTLAREGESRPELARCLYVLGEIASAQDRSSDAASFYRSAFEARASDFADCPTRAGQAGKRHVATPAEGCT
jgi:tetratricopeptide (TPR) repeat protein